MRSMLAWPLFLLLAPPSAFASAPTKGNPIPIPVDLSEPLALRDFGRDLESACTPIYVNESISTGYYLPVAPNVELADDLHTTLAESQVLCGFDLGYYKPGEGLVNATVTFYANNPFDAEKGAVLAGPYLVQGLPSGPNAFHIEVQGGMLQPDLWMGVAFDDGVTGMLSFGPPTLGSSHDLVWFTPTDFPPGFVTNFGGTPPADLFLAVYTSPSTPVHPATWGSLKAYYR